MREEIVRNNRLQWTTTTLGQLFRTVTGRTPPKKEKRNYGGHTLFVKPPDIENNIVRTSIDMISEYGRRSSRIAPAGAVLVTCIGNLGKVGLLKEEAAFNQQINAIYPNDQVIPQFVFYQAQSLDFKRQLDKLSSATTVAIVNKGKFNTIKFSYPPLPQQRAIVAKLEALFSELDRSMAELEVAREKLGVWRSSVLREAFSGRLTGAKSKAAVDHVPLGTFLINIQAGKSFKCEERPPTADEVGVAKVSAVSWGEYQEDESKTTHEPRRINPDYFIQPGDFLMSRANTIELVGACVIVNNISKKIMLSDKTLRLNFNGGEPKFFLYYLRSHRGRKEIEKRSSGNQASMRNIGQKRIKSIPVPNYSTVDQRLIVEQIESRFSVADKLEEEIVAGLERARGLRQGVLQRAFSGELLT